MTKFTQLNALLRALLIASSVAVSAFISLPSHAQTPIMLTSMAQLPTPAPLHLTKLIVVDTQVGTGEVLANGMTAQMHYTGWLYNHKATDLKGAQFDSSSSTGVPLNFLVGGRQVIRGWDIGVIGMKVGGKRTLLIPAYLAYSVAGSNNIPPNTHLIFEIELVGIEK